MVFCALALLALAVTVGAAGGVSLGALVLGGVEIVFLLVGLYFLTHVVAAVDVDLEKRTYALVRGGRPAGGGALDELGPLRVERVERVYRSDDDADRRRTAYVVKPAGYGFLELYSCGSPTAARREMETLARRWKVSCRSMDGPVRAPEHLDAPLHQRLRDDAEARVPATLKPEWRVGIGPIFRGHAIVSHHRSLAPLFDVFIFVGIAACFLLANELDEETVRRMAGDTFGRVLLGLGAAVLLALAWRFARALLDVFRPGAIEVNDRGVSYRWSRMRFSQIEEITTGHGIEIVGDRRVMVIPPSFCPAAAVKPVAHELQRLILETAPRAGI
jgi:hypothetical protein